MSKPGPKPMVKPAWHPADDLTEMQRRFVDFLAYRQGRSTFTKAAIEAGYSEKRANREGSELMKNPKVQRYYRWKCNQINRSQAVNHTNYLNQQIRLSAKLEDKGKEEKCAPFENLIGKAAGLFSETHYHGDLNKMTMAEKLEEIKRLKKIQAEKIDMDDTKLISE